MRHAREVEELEAMALKEGTRIAAEWCQHPAVFEVDCSAVVEMVKRRGRDRSRIRFIIDEAIQDVARLSEWSVIHTRSESNRLPLSSHCWL